MTDNGIIEALGACLRRGCNVCIRQPKEYGVTERQCSRGLMKDTLSLINRQKADIDYWKRNAFDGCMERSRIEKTAKAEAIKEFAERLKEFIVYVEEFECHMVEYFSIEQLVKEMVGD